MKDAANLNTDTGGQFWHSLTKLKEQTGGKVYGLMFIVQCSYPIEIILTLKNKGLPKTKFACARSLWIILRNWFNLL